MTDYLNPYSGEFVSSDSRPRFRARDTFLDKQGRLIPDNRPVATAIAFAPDIMPEQQVQAMLQRAYDDQRAKMKAAYEQGIDIYPVDEDVDDDLEFDPDSEVDPRYSSPHELVHDEVAGCDVTRALKGMFKPKEQPTEEPLAPKAPKVAAGGKGKQAKPAIDEDDSPELDD